MTVRAITFQGALTRQQYGRYYHPWIGALVDERGSISRTCGHRHYKRDLAAKCAKRMEASR